jgi:type VI secretion system secreted protein VgrG
VDIEKAVRYMQAHALSHSTNRCAKFLREALQAAGAPISNPPTSAKDYGPFLERLGMKKVPLETFEPHRGDIVVLQPPPEAAPDGHIAMFDGEVWISDFFQKDIWAGPAFRLAKPTMEVYRQ